MKLVMTVEELAQQLDCAPTTVRERAKALGGLKFGRDWVFPIGAVERRLQELALQAPPAPAAQVKPAPARRAARARPVLPDLPLAQR
jgi:hypothetical protein